MKKSSFFGLMSTVYSCPYCVGSAGSELAGLYFLNRFSSVLILSLALSSSFFLGMAIRVQVSGNPRVFNPTGAGSG
jgi:hypothetical protein